MEIPLKPDGKPDINKLISIIEKDVSESVKNDGFEMPRYTPIQTNLEALQSPQHTQWLSYLNLHWNDWSLPVSFTSHRVFLGKIILKFKSIFQRCLRTTLSEYFEKEINYHRNMLLQLNHMSKYVDDRDANIFWSLNKKVDQEISAVNTRTDEIFDRLANEVLVLKERIKELEKKKVA